MRALIILLICTTNAMAQVQVSNNTRADVIEIEKSWQANGRKVSVEMRKRFAINSFHGKECVSFVAVVNDHFDKEVLAERSVLSGSRVGDIVSLRYPIDQLDEIYNEVGLESIEIAGKVRPTLNRVPIGTRADSVWAGYGLPQGYTGKDIVIGITDWGFDYGSPNFYDTLLQNTRILGAWDQYKTSGPAPQPYGYGAEYVTPQDLDAAQVDTANIYSYSTHGTHVAGIAGGSGAGTEYRGLAFECEYLFVTFLVDEAAVLDAWEWMFNQAQAQGKHLVINMSWGLYHISAIDGTSPLSQAIDNYTNQGVLFVTSGGNNGNVTFHLQHDFAADTIKSEVDFYTNAGLSTLWGQSIHAWGEAGNDFSIGIQVLDGTNQVLNQSPLYNTATTTAYVDSFLVVNTDTIWFNLSEDAAFPSNGRPQARLRVKYPPVGYDIAIYSTASNGSVHYWNVTELTNDVGNWGMPFSFAGTNSIVGDINYGIGAPACTRSVVTVAAYSSEYYIPSGALVGGAPASFSSLGPLMNDSLKPDVTAPGVGVGSSISSYTDASYSQIASVDFNGRTYPFARFSGTSMSSPATAGVAALVWDANTLLTAAQVKQILIETARTDSHTGPIPPHSTKWGWGKVNAYAAVQLALNTIGLGVDELEDGIEWTIVPNPSSDNISIHNLAGDLTSIKVIDTQGKVVKEENSGDSIDVSTLQAGVYYLRLVVDGKVEQRKFVRN